MIALTVNTSSLIDGLDEICALFEEITDGSFNLVHFSPKLFRVKCSTTVGAISTTFELSDTARELLLTMRALKRKLLVRKKVGH
jgi:hypothetical protein